MVDLYHKAARDGILEILKTSSKRDANRRDEDSLTPVHYAASCGNVEALRLLVGKGGDPDKPTSEGSTAVHLAAGCGQLNCLSFLTNFGANIWALDNEGHTPLEEAALHGRMECVRHLDGLVAIQTLRNKKATERLKRHAKREAMKRMKRQSKLEEERDKAYERRIRKESKENTPIDSLDGSQSSRFGMSERSWDVNSARSTLTNGIYSNNGYSFSELAGISSGEDNLNGELDESRSVHSHSWSDSLVTKSRFLGALKSKIGTLGKRSTRSTASNSNVILMRSKSKSEPDMLKRSQGVASTSSGIGSLTDDPAMLYHHPLTGRQSPRRHIEELESDDSDDDTASVGHIMKKYDDKGNITTEIQYIKKERRENGSLMSHTSQQSSHQNGTNNDLASLQSAGFDDFNSETPAESTEMKAVVTFLASLNLEQFAEPFLKESIDLSALLLCDDKDLQSIGLPLGPRRKILEAIKRRNVALRFPGAMNDSRI